MRKTFFMHFSFVVECTLIEIFLNRKAEEAIRGNRRSEYTTECVKFFKAASWDYHCCSNHSSAGSYEPIV
ncbi:hypothetical protein KTT_11270 [Tengunoibacter tsumagoiensis]|uniref:Uncharacterized protein n=1 Tax=Tengunoibacter tsumagoiensis TaxID=2014871 RepID=A0A401ZWM2_9CHLR|nr:hypothetical protein KTT_11270 [Tengunoibacter tsumagoiensis]